MSFNSKEISIIDFLMIFYKNKIEFFEDIIYQRTPLSLRLLDWLVTNYSKKYNIVYPLQNSEGDTIYFNIYLDYKNQLKAYSKKLFDPFCREKRLVIDTTTMKWKPYEKKSQLLNKEIVTTVGQLNFFRWFIENKISEYAMNNVKLIDADMMSTISSKKKGRRTVLSPSAVKGIYTNTHTISISFKH